MTTCFGPNVSFGLALVMIALMNAFGLVELVDANVSAATEKAVPDAAQNLRRIQEKILEVEKSLIQTLKAPSARGADRALANRQLGKIRELMRLHQQEKEIQKNRLTVLQRYVAHLEKRRSDLRTRIQNQERMIRRFLIDIDRSDRLTTTRLPYLTLEKIEAPKREILARMANKGVREVEALRVDLVDAEELNTKIERERNQLAYLFEELHQREAMLKFHQDLQADILARSYEKRMQQLNVYHELKEAENSVENLMTQFKARLEFEKLEEAERVATRSMYLMDFLKQKGKLAMPVSGKILSSYGKSYDPKTRLQVFRKGIEIEVGKNDSVKAVFEGRVVFASRLPKYGQVVIVDHGGDFYSLMAKLGEVRAELGSYVQKGDVIGLTDAQATPLYFEIRSKNVPVNPLQWVNL